MKYILRRTFNISYVAYLLNPNQKSSQCLVQPCEIVQPGLHHWHFMPQWSCVHVLLLCMFFCFPLWFSPGQNTPATDFTKSLSYSFKLTAEKIQVMNGLNLHFFHDVRSETPADFWHAAQLFPFEESIALHGMNARKPSVPCHWDKINMCCFPQSDNIQMEYVFCWPGSDQDE